MSKNSLLNRASLLEGSIKHRGILGTVVEHLGVRIVGSEWSENEAVPKEAALVEELGVSRSVIREAFRMLSAKGLIFSRTSDGTRVQPRSKWRLLDPDLMEWRIKSGETHDLLNDLLKTRLVLEPGITFSATQTATDSDRQRVTDAWNAKVAVFEDDNAPEQERRNRFIETDLEFHRALIACVQSELLNHLFLVIEAALALLIDLQMKGKGYTDKMIGMEESHVLHQDVYDAFMAGDATVAEEAMKALINRAISDAHEGMKLVNN
ncbi:putative transcriptional regulator, GntR family [Vibrio nigripulchritudo SFn27]|uniref:Putative transcriptional regulator, GntR family n=1 Tax=Vibrio nigripulchritudo TaxID=28173 RepID=U4KFI5_9VIBR|nr:FCD domain-containing protein [Vibrio nigripulchritudo]CCN84129.1 putative transcriptional regulator, GntR family [Vibrio nigripulchritudo BLFn1]CCN87044.1 putative transcriptional regulator, GntR family [Vibrio nigripulchritudo SFn27]CCN93251.1 putative transcriptional regulator, GntR family [Vibrio nigripulchritudo ENn2]CCO39459.1 putative transcriptional regulator, GntR family [Vibrio nigripulchritudo SFn135]CCO54301.1 putative transcriptional regulator, GntR family [Vibrio nigripulchrit